MLKLLSFVGRTLRACHPASGGHLPTRGLRVDLSREPCLRAGRRLASARWFGLGLCSLPAGIIGRHFLNERPFNERGLALWANAT